MMGADPQVLELDRNRAWVGLLEEDEARPPGPVEDPISEEPQDQVSERDQSTALLISAQETPTSKLGKESEMPEEV